MIGGFLVPPLGNSLAGIGPGVPFFFWSGLAALSLPLFLFLRKPKENNKEVKEAINGSLLKLTLNKGVILSLLE